VNASVVSEPIVHQGGKISLSSICMMDDARNYDVIFTLSDGKNINSHSFVLQYRCPKLFDLYNKKKPKGKSRKPVTIDMKDNMNPDSFRVLIQFIYADNIEFPAFSPIAVLNIVFASHQLELERLARLGEEHLRANLGIDMVFSLLKGLKYDSLLFPIFPFYFPFISPFPPLFPPSFLPSYPRLFYFTTFFSKYYFIQLIIFFKKRGS
jgi:hypothetical protein